MNSPRFAAKIALAALVVAGLGLVASAPAFACTCIPPTFEEEYASTSHVFTAHRIGSHSAEPAFPDQHYEVLAVHAVWKGAVTPVVEVLVANHENSCGLNLEPDREYVVFAREAQGILVTSSCSRTGSYPPGDPIWSQLGPPRVTPVLSSSWGGLKSSYHR